MPTDNPAKITIQRRNLHHSKEGPALLSLILSKLMEFEILVSTFSSSLRIFYYCFWRVRLMF